MHTRWPEAAASLARGESRRVDYPEGVKSKFVMAGVVAIGFLFAQDPTASVWDGVYSKAEADRGRTAYTNSCASCHGDQLTGGEIAPALAGGDFLSNWNGLTVGQLFDRTRTGMPPGNPASVTRDTKVDIIAYILSYNRFPAGEKDLPSQTAMLNTIRIDAEKPAK
jgi:mono/diheme cytochrome c family protein